MYKKCFLDIVCIFPTVCFSNSTFLNIRNPELFIKCQFQTLHLKITTCKMIKTILRSCFTSRNNTAAIVMNLAGKNNTSQHIRLGVSCTNVPCRPLPLRGPCDVVQVLYPSRSCPPLFPPIS